ncbi:glutamate--tRNA ligase [Candidatus Phycosocius spiralis]|uniref:Glutamate--tRNA ligase n=1 Tax=Candidatus Phycosocius spiralis TaxID=2815099 RepID=A0ABQ4PSW6_9PROT|nr:glutamate--tRNA ligase [Candidatus Phycosocius spiralis]GIU66092.1 glutamate--tRNA ligase 2 [Candidatus Phycosocius spiralis]
MHAPTDPTVHTHEATGSAIVTRFAPSPTGFLHIGGARTALFNWLFARKAGGKYLLRIEDTDRERSTQPAVDAILAGLAWLGLEADGPPTFQFTRAARHQEAATSLVASGGAYHCYLSKEEESALKEEARAKGLAFRSPWRDPDYGTPPTGASYVTRLRAPSDNTIIEVMDKVQGRVVTAGREIDDFILLRSDHTPTYMLAVVVDDHDMGVTHIIRGDDHLTNAARQSVLIKAFGWPVPVYAHIPLIHGDDGKKLSKRHGALGVDEYRRMGYLPEAMRAYLLRLGWSKGDLDIVSTDEALALFDLEGLGRSPARLDFVKMGSVNAHFIRLADDTRLMELLREQASQSGIDLSAIPDVILKAALPYLKPRAQTLPDLLDQLQFILAKRPITLDEKASKALSSEAIERIRRLRGELSLLIVWQHDEIKGSLDRFAGEENIGIGKIGPAVRAALTGGLAAPDLAVTMQLLGKQETLGRLDDII